MNTAVVTIAVGENYEQIARMTHPSLKAYADKIGAEFIVINKSGYSTPHWCKYLIHGLLNRFNRIIYIDTDAIVREDCPNLFDIVPDNRLGMYDEGLIMKRKEAMDAISASYNEPLKDWSGKYYNTGVMVVSRVHKELFKKPDQEVYNFYEQSYINLRIANDRIMMFDLPGDFNRMHALDKVTGIHRLHSYIVHYAGILAGLNNVIPQDLAVWKSGEWKNFKQNIVLSVGANRLGDNICAEPTVRYITEQCPNAIITVAAVYPEVFRHLPVRAVNISDCQLDPSMPYLTINLSPDEKHPSREFLTGDRMNAVDYTSLIAIKRTLPEASKRIKLPVTATGMAEVIEISGPPGDMVLLHPGISWPSKTIPSEYWNKLIERLCGLGYKLGVIGQTLSLGRGVCPLILPECVTDYRHLLSTEGLFAIISLAPVLITNDSAPLHIAGAFDNHIICLPTCKHPDQIMPASPKAKALYKKISDTFDITNLNKNLHNCDVIDCLPEIEDVVAALDAIK